jgi:hypothetical protein
MEVCTSYSIPLSISTPLQRKYILTAKPGGLVTNSQLFPFTAGQSNILLAPENANNATCLVVNAAGKLDSTACSADVAGQSFSIV